MTDLGASDVAGLETVSALETVSGVAPGVPAGAAVADDLTLYSGSMRVESGSKESVGRGRVWMTNIGGLDVRWHLDTTDRALRISEMLDLGAVTLHIDHPELGQVAVPATVTNSAGAGSVQYASLEPDSSPRVAGEDELGPRVLSYVTVHWFGMLRILPATGLTDGSMTYGGRWVCEANGWRMTLDRRPDQARMDAGRHLRDVLNPDGRIPMSHVARMERVTGTFTVAEAEAALDVWRVAFSFAAGRWVAPAVPVGYDDKGRLVWEQWADYRCSPTGGYFSWWDNHRSGDLETMCRLLFEAHDDSPDDLYTALRHSIHHAVSASSDRTTTEARVMLAQAGS